MAHLKIAKWILGTLVFSAGAIGIAAPQESDQTRHFSKFYTVYPEYDKDPYHPIWATVSLRNDTLFVQITASFDSTLRPLAQGVQRDGSTGKDDMVWIILDMDHMGKDGFLFAVNTLNTQWDLKITNVDQIAIDWNYDWKSNVHVDATSWIAELQVPLRGLMSKTTDTIGINILRGAIRRPGGGIELVSLTSLPKGAPLVNVQFTQPFAVQSLTAPSAVRGYLLPYVRLQRLTQEGSVWKVPFGIEAKVQLGQHQSLGTYRPDFSFVGATAYSLDIQSNRYYASENRYFFMESQKFTNFSTNTFYSKLISDDIPWGIQYGFDGGSTKLFLLSLRSPLVSNIFTGSKTALSYWYSMLAGSQSFGNVQVQANLSNLDELGAAGGTRSHFDFQGLYAPSWISKLQVSYDNFHRAPLAHVSLSATRTQGLSLSGEARYISPKYDSPLAFLRFGNNNYSGSIDGNYTWTFERSIVPSFSVGANSFVLGRVDPGGTQVRSGILYSYVEVLPLLYLSHRFVYDVRPLSGFINRYHVLNVSMQHQRYGSLFGGIQTGTFSRLDFIYRRIGLSFNPFALVRVDGNFASRTLGDQTDEFYTILVTYRVTSDLYLRTYYQHISVPAFEVKEDVLNFLVSYYVTNQNLLYVLVNLRDSFKTVDMVARVGVKVRF